MTWFDYAVLGVIGLSLLLGVFRGLVKELISLVGWVAAAVIASMFASQLSEWVPPGVGNQVLRVAIAFVIVFLAVVVTAALLGWALSMLIKAAGMGLADRILGAMFGLFRGVLIVLVAVMLAGLTMLPQDPIWKQAVLSGPLETAVVAVKPLLPRELAQRIRFK
jgi:membrane protein required for colicin V production